MKALCVENLCKEYPSFRLHDVSFSVEEGRIVGLIGRNGAGKSTTMKGLLRFIRTDGGRVLFFGKDIARHEREIKEQIGYVAGGFSYYPLKKLRSIGKCAARFYKAGTPMHTKIISARSGWTRTKSPPNCPTA